MKVKLQIRIIVMALLIGILLHAEPVCVRLLDPAKQPLPQAKVLVLGINRSSIVPVDVDSSQPKQAFFCFLGVAGEYLKISVSLPGFISTSYENVKVLPKIGRKLTLTLEFQNMEFDEYK